ncbi:MAG: LIC_13387 family protein [Pyrinomonadaceae bacterium]
MSQYLLIAGGTIFSILGLLHAIYTVCDIYRPRYLAPKDQAVIDQMAAAGVRLARGRANMWDAWLGFNLSHSLGVVMFGLVCVGAGVFARSLAVPRATLLIPVLVGVIYLLLAIRFWFRTPTVGVAIGTGLLFLGWVSY